MKFVRFSGNGYEQEYGVLSGDTIEIILGSPFDEFKFTDKRVSLKNVKLLPPVKPSKILCVGLNYADHIEEINTKKPDEPIIFTKPNTALIGNREKIILPGNSNHVDYEAELAVVIGKKAKKVQEKDALNYVFGYTCANDVSDREHQPMDGQWTLGKGHDTFFPLGPCIATDINYENLVVKGILNGKVVQNASVKLMLFTIPELIAYISQFMTLLPGDIISTGTPAGIGRLKKGDVFTVSIDQIGDLINEVE